MKIVHSGPKIYHLESSLRPGNDQLVARRLSGEPKRVPLYVQRRSFRRYRRNTCANQGHSRPARAQRDLAYGRLTSHPQRLPYGNLARRITGMSLPKTFRDAVSLILVLGNQHLWIERLRYRLWGRSSSDGSLPHRCSVGDRCRSHGESTWGPVPALFVTQRCQPSLL